MFAAAQANRCLRIIIGTAAAIWQSSGINEMEIRKYSSYSDARKVMQIIKDEPFWGYADDSSYEKYLIALEKSISYVACLGGDICGFSRSLNDCGFDIYVCDLLVRKSSRGKGIGSMLLECICKDYPGQAVYVMSDADGYYLKAGYKKIGSVFEVGKHPQNQY
jgi:GNAT superfamily N-acetyltransferase